MTDCTRYLAAVRAEAVSGRGCLFERTEEILLELCACVGQDFAGRDQDDFVILPDDQRLSAGPTPDKEKAQVGTTGDRSATCLGTSQRADSCIQELLIAIRVVQTVMGGVPKLDFAERFTGGGRKTYFPLL